MRPWFCQCVRPHRTWRRFCANWRDRARSSGLAKLLRENLVARVWLSCVARSRKHVAQARRGRSIPGLAAGWCSSAQKGAKAQPVGRITEIVRDRAR
jgi:hypothetical protein